MKIVKLLLKSLIYGVLILILFNIIGSYINLNVPINLLTIFVVGILRIPGLVVLMIYINFL